MKKLMMILLTLSSLVYGLDIDTEKSSFEWEGTKKVGEGHSGQIFLKHSELIEIDGAVSGGTFVMDMKTFTVGNLEGKWADKFLNHMKSADFFDVAKYPTAKLEISEIKDGKASGQLTIMGKTQPVTFDVSQKGKSYEGILAFDRTKFGMVYGSENFFKNLGDKVINNEVTLKFSVTVK